MSDSRQTLLDVSERAYLHWLTTAGLFPGDTLFIPVPNHPLHLERMLKQLDLDFLLLVGGNNPDPSLFGNAEILTDLAPLRDQVERRLFDWAREKSLPCLGICRGSQMINLFLGGSLSLHLKDHPAGIPHPCLYRGQTYQVNSYHGHGMAIDNLASELIPLVTTEDGRMVEAYRGRRSPLLGVMWHPERPDTDPELFRQLFQECFGCL